VAYDSEDPIVRRLELLEGWQTSVAPMLKQLAEDQAYRARWMQERSSRNARFRRNVAWIVAAVSGLVVAAASVVQLVHLF